MQRTDRSLFRVALPIIVVVTAINFLTMPAEEYPGDANAVRAETITLLNTGKWAVPPETAQVYGPRGQYFYQNAKGNRYPKYGVLNTLVYVPPLWLRKIATGTLEDSADNTLFLNLLNVLLSGATALYLFLLARRYTKSNAITSIFVLACLFSTFWWNYLRAETFEIYHTVFLLAFYYHFVSALELDRTGENNRRRDTQLFAVAIYFGALCLSKSAYVVLLPAIVLVLARSTMSPNPRLPGSSFIACLKITQWLRRRSWATQPIGCNRLPLAQSGSILPDERRLRLFHQLLYFWVPTAIFLCVLAGTNWYKFDSPFTTGYTQWETERQLFKPANIFPALWGFLFSPHHSVFLHFPPLLFALAGWPNFFRKHRFDATVAALLGLTLLLVSSLFVNWRGESSYGPRYLLPILPILTLPFLEYLKWLGNLPKIAKSVLATGTATLLAYSLLLQMCVNTLPFFFCYDLKQILDDNRYSKPATYLRSHHFGTINRDFLLYKRGCSSPFTGKFLDQLNAAEVERFSARLESLRSNYYWFPGLLH